MGVMSRMSTVVKSKMNRLLDRAEDPRETLDYAYDKQREMLQNVKRGIVEMVTTKRRLQLQAEKVRANIANVDNQARQAMAAGREDLARMAPPAQAGRDHRDGGTRPAGRPARA